MLVPLQLDKVSNMIHNHVHLLPKKIFSFHLDDKINLGCDSHVCLSVLFSEVRDSILPVGLQHNPKASLNHPVEGPGHLDVGQALHQSFLSLLGQLSLYQVNRLQELPGRIPLQGLPPLFAAAGNVELKYVGIVYNL